MPITIPPGYRVKPLKKTKDFFNRFSRDEVKTRFAFLPKPGQNNKRIWFKRYIRHRTFIWGLAGESPVIKEEQNFLPAEYTFWLLKNGKI